MKPSTWTAPHVVYKCYDDAGALLYVGFTSNFDRRWSQHHSTFPDLVTRTAKVVQEPHPDRKSAAEAESRCIDFDAPLLNRRRGHAYTPSLDEQREALTRLRDALYGGESA
jgi:hypothetical protein